jgi:exonuclease SbcD
MRVAVIADSHFDEASRFDECVRVHRWIADDMRARGVELVLHGGDVFERKSTVRERAAVADWIQNVADFAPVVMVRGNHDAVGDLSIFSRLETRHPVIVEERAGAHVVAGVEVACLAWPQTAQLKAIAPDLDASEALRAVLRGFNIEQSERPRILLAHAMVCGSKTSHGQPLVGHDLEIGLADLALAGASFVALGHIHMPQDWPLEAGPVVYPGSPRRTAFGEVEEKGYVIVDLWPGQLGWQRVPTPCAPMLLVEAELSANECAETGADIRSLIVDHNPSDDEIRGAEIRLRYRVRSDERDHARIEADGWRKGWLVRGAASVKVEEEVIATGTARAPEIATATTIAAKLDALWKVRQAEPEPERAARLVSLATGLEAA